MASIYGVITVANLELFAGIDYSALYSGYIDTVIEANISQAERIVLSYCGNMTIVTNPIVIAAVTEYSKRLMYNLMIHDTITGYSDKKPIYPILDSEMKEALDMTKSQKKGHANSIPMRNELNYGRLYPY
jgi:hypothetical protein